MRVLWFSNTPANASNVLNKTVLGGGWIKSLETQLVKTKKIDLGVAFFNKEQADCFKKDNVAYYPIYNKKDKLIKKGIALLKGTDELKGELSIFLKIINDFKPDIIHIHGTEGTYGKLVGITDIPIVISIQGVVSVITKKYFSGISKKDTRKYEGIIKKLTLTTAKRAQKLFQKKSQREIQYFSNAKYIIGRTDFDRRITHLLAPSAKYYKNDEILRTPFYETNWDDPQNKIFTIHTTTSSGLYKGLETIMETAILLNKFSRLNYKWNIAGLTANDSIVKLCLKKLGIKRCPTQLQFTGKKSEDELAEQMLNSNLFVMPSHIENSSNSLSEALLIGLPAIATSVGGTFSLLDGYEYGTLIQDGDPFSMAGAILDVFSQYDAAKEKAKKAQLKALKRHNKSTITNDLIKIYSDILNEN